MKPLGNKIKLKIDELKFGAIESDAIAEQGTILAMGPLVPEKIRMEVDASQYPLKAIETDAFKIGATLYFKAWAVDIITDTDGSKHYFISSDSDAICAISD